MTHRRTRPSRCAFTLVEMLATVSVLGLSLAAALPIVSSVADSAHRANAIARDRHEVSIALERIAAIVRASGNPDDASTMLTRTQSDELRLATGVGVSLVDGSLMERDTQGRTHPLARSIDQVEFLYLRDDGRTPAATATEVHSVQIRIDTPTTSCATRVFLRGRLAIP